MLFVLQVKVVHIRILEFNHGCRYKLNPRQPFHSLERLCNLEELYLMGVSVSEYPPCSPKTIHFDAALLQTFKKLRVAVLDIHGSLVSFFSWRASTQKVHIVLYSPKSRTLHCLLSQ